MRRVSSPAGRPCRACFVALLGAALAAGVAACAEQPPVAVSTVLSGRVVSPEGRPLPGAIVEVFDGQRRFGQRQHTTANAEGRYELVIDSDPKLFTVAASADGFVITRVELQRSAERVALDFELEPPQGDQESAFGKVIDEAGEPIAGAQVEAFTPRVGFHSSFSHPTGRDLMPGPDRVVITDAAGRFRIDDLPLDLTNGQVQLSLRSPHRHVNDRNHAVGEPLVITMRGSGRAGVVRGRLLDAETGEPIAPPAKVRIVRRHRTEVHREIDPQGRFELPGRATLNDRYSVYAYVAGYAAATVRCQAVAADSDAYHEVRLTPAPPLRVRFVDAKTSSPLAGVRALYGIADDASYFEWNDFDRYTDGHHSLDYVQHVTSDDGGEAWFAEPIAGVQRVLIGFADGYQRFMLSLGAAERDPATNPVTVSLHREAVVTGLVSSGPDPAAGERVKIAGAKRHDMEPWYPGIKTDDRGRYRVGGLAPGSYRLWANGCFKRIELGPSESIEVNLGADIGDIKLHGTAPAGAAITLRPEFEWEYQSLSAVADEDGRYELSGLRAGRYKVEMLKWTGGFRQRMRAEIAVEPPGGRVDFRWKPAVRKAPAKPLRVTRAGWG